MWHTCLNPTGVLEENTSLHRAPVEPEELNNSSEKELFEGENLWRGDKLLPLGFYCLFLIQPLYRGSAPSRVPERYGEREREGQTETDKETHKIS